MEDERRNVIINEIKYWKQHKLLPEQYCDYLLALYTEGEDENNFPSPTKNRFPSIVERFQTSILFLLLPLAFVVIYFTEFHIHLQLVIVGLLFIYSLWVLFFYRRAGSKRLYHHSALIVSLFLFLFLCIMSADLFLDQQILTRFIIALNFLFWVMIGYLLRYKYLMTIGFICLFFQFLYYYL